MLILLTIYNPKTRSMREDPLPDADPNENFYGENNKYRMSGQASEFKQPNVQAWEAFEKGQDIHMQAAPSQAELLYKNFKMIKEKLWIIKGQETSLPKQNGTAALLQSETAAVLTKCIADTPPAAEEKRFVTWGTDVPDDMVLDHEKLVEALKKVSLDFLDHTFF
ncbi:hypothetical protein P8452_08663 [Trifolium repens]|nr:hypothetical protein P8452_08663 [Trifolium repens]